MSATTKGKSTARERGIHGRGKGRDESARPRAEGQDGWGNRRARGDRKDVAARIAPSPSGSTSSIKATAPDLTPKTWYGMPAYAKDGKVVCFFRDAGKFKERYAMLGFNDSAKLDQGSMWPIAFALTKLTAADEAKIRALVKKAVG